MIKKTSVFAVTVALAILPASARAAGPACARWNTEVTECDVYPNVANCASGGLSFSQRRNWKSKLYVKTFEEACSNWKKYGYPNQAAPYASQLISPTQARCSVDDNGNGLPDDAIQAVLDKEPDVRESCCKREPNGPNKALTIDGSYAKLVNPINPQFATVVYLPPAYGREFSTLTFSHNGTVYVSQIERIRNWNKARFGGPSNANTWYTDLKTGNDPAMIALETASCGGVLNNSANAPWECKPQVHHMIPRVDENGCDCGPNSAENALVISAKLNGEMSNNCNDPKMIAILDKWAPENLAGAGAAMEQSPKLAMNDFQISRARWQESLATHSLAPMCVGL
ncbi:MAG: hypothetical protein JNL21_14365 [Myxococcales bacterium]|nr:hypothetical protein [Myxococcales bacterium]